MSQSDYIHYKRIATELKSQSKISPVMTSRQYTNYSAFSLENQVFSTNPVYAKDIPSDAVSIFGIVRVPADCPSFPICSSTNLRANRKPMMSIYANARPIVPKPAHKTLIDSAECKRKNCENPILE